MAKQKTIPELEAEKAENERKITQLQHKKQQLENRITYYEKGDRRKRAHHLITRGAAIESVAPLTKVLTETEFYAFAEKALAVPEIKGLLITPQPGDVVFYDWQDSGSGDDRGAADHVGIVSSVSGRVLKVIEGNFSNSVKERTLEVNGKYLRGFGLPAYYTKTDNKEDFDMDINEARKQLTSCADTGDTPSAWAKEAAEYCKRKGIFNGDGAGNFGWQQPITREAVACIIYRALEAAGALGNLSDV